MQLLTAPTKTNQVIGYLKNQLESDDLQPGDKLLSARKLAKRFSTSEQVIKSAYNVLEKEGLVFKRARSGVFVNKHSELSHVKEVYVIGIGISESERYFKEILKMTYPPLIKEGFSFIVRTYSSELPAEAVLNMEINRVNNMVGLDAVLINAVSLTRKDVLQCQRIEKPLIFIGDFNSGEMEDMRLNQITGDNSYIASQQIKYMLGKGFEEMTLFSGSQKHYYNKLFCDTAKKEAGKLNVALNIVEFPIAFSGASLDKQHEIAAEILRKTYDKRQIHAAGLNNLMDFEMVKSIIFEIDPTFHDSILFMPDYTINYSKLHDAITTLVEKVGVNDDSVKNRVKLPIEIIESK